VDVNDLIRIYLTLDLVIQQSSDAKIYELLSGLPVTDGYCLPFSHGLFHDRIEIQMAAARIIMKIYIQKVLIKLNSCHQNMLIP
jgi:hypothetical protein